jgi:hypothetical protein
VAGEVIRATHGTEVEAGVVSAACGAEGEAGVVVTTRGTREVVEGIGRADHQRGLLDHHPLQCGRSDRLGRGLTVSLDNVGGQTTWLRSHTVRGSRGVSGGVVSQTT